MLTVKIYLDKSDISGIGVFANQFIKKGQEVCRYNPRFTQIIEIAEIETWPKTVQENFYRYAYHGKGDFRIKHALFYNIDESKYLNHSDTPNIIYVPQLEIYVAKDEINSGTELTCDYNDFEERGDACFNF